MRKGFSLDQRDGEIAKGYMMMAICIVDVDELKNSKLNNYWRNIHAEILVII